MSLAMTPTTAAAMGSVPGGQGRRRLGRAEQHAPGRRLARDRPDGRDRRGVRERACRRIPPYSDQFVEGYHNALHVAAAIAIVGAIVAVATVRKVRHPEPEAQPAFEGA